MLLVVESRNLHMSDVLVHPLIPLPWTLANGEGSLRNTDKSILTKELEKGDSSAEVITYPSTTGINLALKMKVNDKTFAHLAEQALSKVLQEGAKGKCIDMVFDVYKEMTITHAERENKCLDGGIHFNNIYPGHNIQRWYVKCVDICIKIK